MRALASDVHELSVCQALLIQVADLVRERGAEAVARITIEVGPLCGTEPVLLDNAFGVMRSGCSAAATLVIRSCPVVIRCLECGADGVTAPNRLVCARCGGWRTQLIGGNELRLLRVEMRMPAATEGPDFHATTEPMDHV
jgi:hydrogenase nickel incorporation protein HypA/HybF